MTRAWWLWTLLGGLWLAAPAVMNAEPAPEGIAMQVRSTAFEPMGEIPQKYTCEGNDLSPPLSWSGAPEGTRAFALIVDDPDAPDPAAPRTTWVHWVIANIPATEAALAEGVHDLPPGSVQGLNDWKRPGYGGPCPPIGRHRYFHKLYALDATLELMRPTKQELERAMRGHILAQADLIGTYQKKK